MIVLSGRLTPSSTKCRDLPSGERTPLRHTPPRSIGGIDCPCLLTARVPRVAMQVQSQMKRKGGLPYPTFEIYDADTRHLNLFFQDKLTRHYRAFVGRSMRRVCV